MGYERFLVQITLQRYEWIVLSLLKSNDHRYETYTNRLQLSFWKMKEVEHLSFSVFSLDFFFFHLLLPFSNYAFSELMKIIPLFCGFGIEINNLKQKKCVVSNFQNEVHDFFFLLFFFFPCCAFCQSYFICKHKFGHCRYHQVMPALSSAPILICLSSPLLACLANSSSSVRLNQAF